MNAFTFLAGKAPEQAFPDWMRGVQTRIEATLSRLLPPEEAIPATLHQAMRYATLGGGKRVRPLLAHAAGELTGAAAERVEVAAFCWQVMGQADFTRTDVVVGFGCALSPASWPGK